MSKFAIKCIHGRYFSSAKKSLLSYKVVGNENAPMTAVFLHGILGSKRNWRTPSNHFVARNPDFRCYIVDHRGHGDSHDYDGENTLQSCAKDLVELFDSMNISPDLLCGHSFGGKVALAYLQERISSKLHIPSNIWVLDSLPGRYDLEMDRSSNSQSVVQVLEVLEKTPQIFFSRESVTQSFIELRVPKAIAQWLATNIVPITDTGASAGSRMYYKWNFEIDVVKELFKDYCETDMWPFLESFDYSLKKDSSTSVHPPKIHFLRAGKNSLWSEEEIKRFEVVCNRNPHIIVHHMPHVGHWVHVDDMNGLLDLLIKSISR